MVSAPGGHPPRPELVSGELARLHRWFALGGFDVNTRDLLDGLWPDVFVGDDALKTCVREIRDALGDDAQAPRYIETAHRRGYRFIAPLSEGGAEG